MRIANPIYDVVFEYLLDDEKVARLVLSALLGREVLDLQFRPTEVHTRRPGRTAPSSWSCGWISPPRCGWRTVAASWS